MPLKSMAQTLRDSPHLLASVYTDWSRDKAMRLSASVAMYAILSLSPLLVITIKVLSAYVEPKIATQQVERQLQALIGYESARAITSMMAKQSGDTGYLATAISFVVLVFTASGVFAELQDALNTVWSVKAIPDQDWKWWQMIRNRLLSMGMVFVIAFLLLVSQFITTALAFLTEQATGEEGSLTYLVDFTASSIVITLLFACIFRFLPDVKINWQDVFLGAIITAVLFKIGQYVLTIYFRFAATSSIYGAAGSFVAVLLWVYYSCWILFFGAEFTKVFARHRGRWILPEPYAEPLPAEERLEQGLDPAPPTTAPPLPEADPAAHMPPEPPQP
jgi:membrane protein